MRIPSTSNASPSGIPQGTMGGRPASAGRPGRSPIMLGDEMYLWLLVIIEVSVMGTLRRKFRRYHGG